MSMPMAAMVVSPCASRGTDDQSSSRLLELPMEIRAAIFHHLFASARLSIEPGFPSVPHCRFSICSCWFPWQIVNTCQQLREEALGYLLAATTVQIVSLPTKLQLLPPVLLSGVQRVTIMNVESYSKRPLDLSILPSLRILEIHNIAVWCQYHDEEYFSGEAGDETMFDLAMFNLKRNSFHLHQLCETSRPYKILLYCRYVVSSVKQETLVR
jgi:hypothetical protein